MITPNSVEDKGSFYVSYNALDVSIYGDVTTALVYGQMEQFYILKGDHRDAYSQIQSDLFEDYLAYYIRNNNQQHDFSSSLPEKYLQMKNDTTDQGAE